MLANGTTTSHLSEQALLDLALEALNLRVEIKLKIKRIICLECLFRQTFKFTVKLFEIPIFQREIGKI
jgi:hypothetical protein